MSVADIEPDLEEANVIQGLFNSGSMPALEHMVGFTGARHKVILHNIANLSTPNFRPREMPVSEFQEALGRAIDERRAERGGGPAEPLDMPEISSPDFDRMLPHHDRTPENILFHDRNNRSLDHQMKNLAENTMTHNAALRMLSSKFELLKSTIRLQP